MSEQFRPRYLTIFDSETGQATLIDPSGTESWNNSDGLIGLCRFILQRDGARELRSLAIGWASEVQDQHPLANPMIDLAQRWVDGKATAEEVQAAVSDYGSAALAAGSVGLMHRCPNAPAYLAAFACLKADSLNAALGAAQMVQIFHRFRALRNYQGLPWEVANRAAEAAGEAAQREQVEKVLGRLQRLSAVKRRFDPSGRGIKARRQ